jgi:hypothetical protein
MQIGIDSFVAAVPDTVTCENLGPADRLSHLLDEIESADRVGWMSLGLASTTGRSFLIPRQKRFWPRRQSGPKGSVSPVPSPF